MIDEKRIIALEKDFDIMRDTLKNVTGAPIIKGYSGRTLTLNDHLDVLRLNKRLEDLNERVQISIGEIEPYNDRWIRPALDKKQDVLIPGANIHIAADGKTISATDTVYDDAWILPALNEKADRVHTHAMTDVTGLIPALNEVAGKIDAETIARIAADDLLNDKIGEISGAVNRVVVTNTTVSGNASTVSLAVTHTNLLTGQTTTTTLPLPVASQAAAGVMNAEDYQALLKAIQDIAGLQGAGYVFADVGQNPSQAQLTTAWTTAWGSAPVQGSHIINIGNNNQRWTYGNQGGANQWVRDGIFELPIATANVLGGIYSSLTDGTGFVNGNGVLSINGWDELTGKVVDIGSTIDAIKNVVNAHIDNTAIHVTQADKNAWNAKQNASAANFNMGNSTGGWTAMTAAQQNVLNSGLAAADKTKLDGIATGANLYVHPAHTARTGVPTGNQTPAFGGTFNVNQVNNDAEGHVTAVTSRTITIPNAVVTASAIGLVPNPSGSSSSGTRYLRQVNANAPSWNQIAYSEISGTPTIPAAHSGQSLRFRRGDTTNILSMGVNDSTSRSVRFDAGTGITITDNGGATDLIYTVANSGATSVNGRTGAVTGLAEASAIPAGVNQTANLASTTAANSITASSIGVSGRLPFGNLAQGIGVLGRNSNSTGNAAYLAPTAANQVLRGTGAGVYSWGALVAADIPNLDAGKITGGTFDAARIPNLDASKINAGTLPVGRGGTGATAEINAAHNIGAMVRTRTYGNTGDTPFTNIASFFQFLTDQGVRMSNGFLVTGASGWGWANNTSINMDGFTMRLAGATMIITSSARGNNHNLATRSTWQIYNILFLTAQDGYYYGQFSTGGTTSLGGSWQRIPWASQLPTVNNAALTLQVNGTQIANNFTANDSTARTYNITQAQLRTGIGTLPIGNGGTGLTANPSMLTNLGSTSAANVLQASPRPGITGTLPIGNGGTGLTANPSMLTNLGSTSAANVLQASPRPGITGTLGRGNGGTGETAGNTFRRKLMSGLWNGSFADGAGNNANQIRDGVSLNSDDIRTNSFMGWVTPSEASMTSAAGGPYRGWAGLINIRHREGVGDGNNFGSQLFIGTSNAGAANQNRLWIRSQNNGTWTPWEEFIRARGSSNEFVKGDGSLSDVLAVSNESHANATLRPGELFLRSRNEPIGTTVNSCKIEFNAQGGAGRVLSSIDVWGHGAHGQMHINTSSVTLTSLAQGIDGVVTVSPSGALWVRAWEEVGVAIGAAPSSHTHDINAASITGTPLTVARGGTGATTGANAPWLLKTGGALTGGITITHPITTSGNLAGNWAESIEGARSALHRGQPPDTDTAFSVVSWRDRGNTRYAMGCGHSRWNYTDFLARRTGATGQPESLIRVESNGDMTYNRTVTQRYNYNSQNVGSMEALIDRLRLRSTVSGRVLELASDGDIELRSGRAICSGVFSVRPIAQATARRIEISDGTFRVSGNSSDNVTVLILRNEVYFFAAHSAAWDTAAAGIRFQYDPGSGRLNVQKRTATAGWSAASWNNAGYFH